MQKKKVAHDFGYDPRIFTRINRSAVAVDTKRKQTQPAEPTSAMQTATVLQYVANRKTAEER